MTTSEKATKFGFDSITNGELLALVAWTDEETGKNLYKHFGSLDRIARASVLELKSVNGMTSKRAIQVAASFEINRRRNMANEVAKRVTDSTSTYKRLKPIFEDLDTEHFGVIFLNRNNEEIAYETLFMGGVATTIIDPKVVYKRALLHGASGMIVAHNHPSGSLRPSGADREITKKLVSAGEFFDIVVLDHLIISHRGYYSFADAGEM